MINQLTVFVHSKKDAVFLVKFLSDKNLRKLDMNCIVNNFVYKVFYDIQNDYLVTTCYPYTVKLINSSVRDTFNYVIDSFYEDPL